MASSGPGLCPVCKSNSTVTNDFSLQQRGIFYKLECPRCGDYSISSDAEDVINVAFDMEPRLAERYSKREIPAIMGNWEDLYAEVAQKGIEQSRSIISHVLRKSRIKSVIFPEDLFNILKNNSSPMPLELSNNLIMFLGDILSSPGNTFRIPQHNAVYTDNICGLLGFRVDTEITDLHFIVTSLEKQNLLSIEHIDNGRRLAHGRPIPELISLTLAGWQKYEELKRSVKDSRKAFMAMDFIDRDNKEKDYFFQQHLFPEYLIPAVRDTEFELSNPLASEPKAGNIHARLEVEIRASRFVVAELSHHNSGAYWEAGFARGLGKPVIYMFNKEIGGRDRPHFHVGSDQIVFWKKEEPEAAAKALKGVIRATLFGEARMED